MDYAIKSEINDFEDEENSTSSDYFLETTEDSTSSDYFLENTEDMLVNTVKQEEFNNVDDESDYCFPTSIAYEEIDNFKEQHGETAPSPMKTENHVSKPLRNNQIIIKNYVYNYISVSRIITMNTAYNL